MKKMLCVLFTCALLSASTALAETQRYEGEGAAIESEVRIDAPRRLKVTCSDHTEVGVAGGPFDYTVKVDAPGGESLLYASGDLMFTVESEGRWTIDVQDLKETDTSSCEGVGSIVSDLFALAEPTIFTVRFDFTQSQAVINYASVLAAYENPYSPGRCTDMSVISEYPSEDTLEMDVVVTPKEGVERYAWVIATDPDVAWSIAEKK